MLLNFFLNIHTFSLLFQHQNMACTSFLWMILPHLRAMSIAQILAVLGWCTVANVCVICTGAMVALILGDELAITGKIADGSFCLDCFLAFFFLQEAIHWVGSLLNHCQKIGIDPELVLHMWVLRFSPGSSSSLRGCLLNSPFPAFYLSISCSDFQDAHASGKIYSFHLLYLTTRPPFLQIRGTSIKTQKN